MGAKGGLLPEGEHWAHHRREPGGDFSGIYYLDDATAREVSAKLDDLRERLQAAQRSPGEGRPYLIRTALGRLRSEDLTEVR